MKTKLEAAIDRICAGTITREADALERLGALTDDARMVVDAYSEAQARIETLEWLTEVQAFWFDDEFFDTATLSTAREADATYEAARAAAGA